MTTKMGIALRHSCLLMSFLHFTACTFYPVVNAYSSLHGSGRAYNTLDSFSCSHVTFDDQVWEGGDMEKIRMLIGQHNESRSYIRLKSEKDLVLTEDAGQVWKSQIEEFVFVDHITDSVRNKNSKTKNEPQHKMSCIGGSAKLFFEYHPAFAECKRTNFSRRSLFYGNVQQEWTCKSFSLSPSLRFSESRINCQTIQVKITDCSNDSTCLQAEEDDELVDSVTCSLHYVLDFIKWTERYQIWIVSILVSVFYHAARFVVRKSQKRKLSSCSPLHLHDYQ